MRIFPKLYTLRYTDIVKFMILIIIIIRAYLSDNSSSPFYIPNAKAFSLSREMPATDVHFANGTSDALIEQFSRYADRVFPRRIYDYRDS